MAPRTGRRKSELPDLYHEGYLEKRSFKDKTARKLWTSLCGNTFYFFNEKRENDYVEKLELCGLISVTDDSSPDPNLDAARFNVQMKNGTIKFTAPNAESRELWKGFIHAVAELKVPLSLNLLPGQLHMLRETVKSEKKRLANPLPEPSPPPAVKTEMPICYYEVPRLEAELLLEREASKGNLLVRPGRDGRSFAISTKQDLDGPVFRHYRILSKPGGGFYIDVEKPVHFQTLHDVVTYMVESTDGNLTPLIIEAQYDKNISFISADNENGERTQQLLPVPVSVPEQPRPVTETKTFDDPEPDVEENPPANDQEEEDVRAHYSPPPTPLARKTPPIPAPRKKLPVKPPSSSTSPTSVPEVLKMISDPERKKQILPAALSELKEKLGQKIKVQD
ncbi:signal-transducing adaptor protein 1-like [Cyprinodon tularosa]|uniref:Signal-transducing adaptor protein 1-like n=1 Tax=Cyprinodon variegatus TaxID=28743 RepID=A0A3Q2DD19_CYPVA|nr:PREDICTED: signal-transducing adaptor protein 1-like [Cyprinodon variegatus]XP_038151271.1 signal-transducing adaptor protein 1-like [Cyprinodon tularosa]